MRLVWLGLLSIALSACGFHLRGQFTLPPLLQPVAVVSTVPTLEDRVSAGIQRMGGIVSADAPMQVHITRETVTRQTSTVDRLAKAAEYTLFYELNFQLKYASGVPAQPELAMGAVVDGGSPIVVRNDDVIALAGVSERPATVYVTETLLLLPAASVAAAT